MGKSDEDEEDVIVSLQRPRYPAPLLARAASCPASLSNKRKSRHHVSKKEGEQDAPAPAPAPETAGPAHLWSPPPLPRHVQRQLDGAGLEPLRLLHALATLGLPSSCQRITAQSAYLTDRLLRACLRAPPPHPGPLSRAASAAPRQRPLLWCAGLLRLMSDKLEAKMCHYNANMPSLWADLLAALALRPHARDPLLLALLSEVSDLVCSFGVFLKDAQAFYDNVDSELTALEAFLALINDDRDHLRQRRKRRRTALFVILILVILLLGALFPALPLLKGNFCGLTGTAITTTTTTATTPRNRTPTTTSHNFFRKKT